MYVYIYILGALSLEQRVLRLCVRCVVWRARCPKVQRDCEGITDAHLSRSEGSTQHHRRHPASAVTATKNQRKTRSGILPRPPRATQNRAQNAQKINPGRIWDDLGHPGRFGDASGTPRERSWTLSGRSRALPGHSLDAPEALFGCTGALPGRLGESSRRVRTRFSSGMDTDPIFRRFLFDVSMKIRSILSNDFWTIVDRSTMLSWCQQGCTISKKP